MIYKKLAIVATLITVITGLITFVYNQGYNAATVDVKSKQAELLVQQTVKYKESLLAQANKFAKIEAVNRQKMAEQYEQRERRIITDLKYERDTIAKVETIAAQLSVIDTGCDTISDDAVSLFEQARNIISKPSM